MTVYKNSHKMKKSKYKYAKTFSKLDFAEEGRQDIYNWSERRQKKDHGFRKSLDMIQVYGFNIHLLRSFVENFNFMVILQMSLAAFITYLCKDFDIAYDVHVSLFISPIVFPLAFSINTDFQRKEKVLEDLATFKSSAMMWFFCMRDWREACSMDLEYIKGVRNKIKGIMFHLREYLLTEKLDHRKFIVRVIYEDFSDANQLNEKVRCSSMPANPPLVSRVIHFLNMMCLSFERLRVIREYRSPRSIRSFTKVLIFILPLLLSPYYVYLGTKVQLKSNTGTLKSNTWSPYYISIMVAFVFGALQGVQDKLDDPFDGMSEDDINLDTLDEWTLQSLEATCHRSYKIGRFQVVSSAMDECKKPIQQCQTSRVEALAAFERYTRTKDDISDELELGFHPYAGVLNNIQGNTTVLRHGKLKHVEKSCDDLGSLDGKSILMSQSLFTENQDFQETLMSTAIPYVEEEKDTLRSTTSSLSRLPSVDIIEPELQSASNATLDFAGSEAPTYGVASYLASVRKNSHPLRNQLESRSSKNSLSSNLSKKSSHSPSGSYSEDPTDSRNAEFFIGDEVIQKLSPRHQEVPDGRFTRSNNSSASINPLILNMHLNSDEDSDDDEQHIPLSLANTPLFDNIQQKGSPIFETLQRTSSPVHERLHRTNSPVHERLHRTNSPVHERLHFKRSNSPLLDNIRRSKSVDTSMSNLLDNTRQNNSTLLEKRQGSSPLLKMSNGHILNGVISPNSTKSRFAVSGISKSNQSINRDVMLRDFEPSETVRSHQHQNSPKHHFLSSPTNPLYEHSREDTVKDHGDEEEDSPIELRTTSLLGNISHKRPSVPKTLKLPNSPSSERLNKSNSPLQEHIQNGSPMFDNVELSNIALCDNLSPKSRQRFIINRIGRNNDAIITRDHLIQVGDHSIIT